MTRTFSRRLRDQRGRALTIALFAAAAALPIGVQVLAPASAAAVQAECSDGDIQCNDPGDAGSSSSTQSGDQSSQSGQSDDCQCSKGSDAPPAVGGDQATQPQPYCSLPPSPQDVSCPYDPQQVRPIDRDDGGDWNDRHGKDWGWKAYPAADDPNREALIDAMLARRQCRTIRRTVRRIRQDGADTVDRLIHGVVSEFTGSKKTTKEAILDDLMDDWNDRDCDTVMENTATLPSP